MVSAEVFEPTHGNPNMEVALHFASSASARQLSYTLTAFSLHLLLRPEVPPPPYPHFPILQGHGPLLPQDTRVGDRL